MKKNMFFSHAAAKNRRLGAAMLAAIREMPWAIGRSAFLWILVFVMLSVIAGELLFYQYVIVPKLSEPEIFVGDTLFKENAYASVLKEWQARDTIHSEQLKTDAASPFEE